MNTYTLTNYIEATSFDFDDFTAKQLKKMLADFEAEVEIIRTYHQELNFSNGDMTEEDPKAPKFKDLESAEFIVKDLREYLGDKGGLSVEKAQKKLKIALDEQERQKARENIKQLRDAMKLSLREERFKFESEMVRLKEKMVLVVNSISDLNAKIDLLESGGMDEEILEMEAKRTKTYEAKKDKEEFVMTEKPSGKKSTEKTTKTTTSKAKGFITTIPRPKGDGLFECFKTDTYLRLRYGKTTFYGILYQSERFIAVAENASFQNGDVQFLNAERENVKSLNRWVVQAKEKWLETTSNKNAYEVVDAWINDAWISLIDLQEGSLY